MVVDDAASGVVVCVEPEAESMVDLSVEAEAIDVVLVAGAVV